MTETAWDTAKRMASRDAREYRRRTGRTLDADRYRLIFDAWFVGLSSGDIAPVVTP